jgi:hypothetical protein
VCVVSVSLLSAHRVSCSLVSFSSTDLYFTLFVTRTCVPQCVWHARDCYLLCIVWFIYTSKYRNFLVVILFRWLFVSTRDQPHLVPMSYGRPTANQRPNEAMLGRLKVTVAQVLLYPSLSRPSNISISHISPHTHTHTRTHTHSHTLCICHTVWCDKPA